MCLGAIYWAHIGRIYYGNTKIDAADIDFDDNFIYKELERGIEFRAVPAIPLLHDEAIKTFRAWEAKQDRVEY